MITPFPPRGTLRHRIATGFTGLLTIVGGALFVGAWLHRDLQELTFAIGFVPVMLQFWRWQRGQDRDLPARPALPPVRDGGLLLTIRSFTGAFGAALLAVFGYWMLSDLRNGGNALIALAYSFFIVEGIEIVRASVSGRGEFFQSIRGRVKQIREHADAYHAGHLR